MIVDVRTLPNGTTIAADLCIVGGGVASIAMATQLTGTKLRVSVLEGGGLKFDPATQALAAGERSGVPYFPLNTTRYRLLGGSSFRWGARMSPLTPMDFTHRRWVPHSGWPLSPAALESYYDRVFDFVGLHRPFHFDREVWKLFKLSPPAVDPRLLEYVAFQFGKNLAPGRVYRRQLRDAPNVTVYLHANVLNIRSNARGDHVIGLDVAALTGPRYTFTAGNYVLACGGIENARLLLLSNSVNPAGLSNEHDLVGRYFLEHPTVSAGTIDVEPWPRLQDVFSPGVIGGRFVEIGLALSPALQEARQCLNAVARPIPVVPRDGTQALRELRSHLKRGRLPPELTRLEQRQWLGQRLGAVARDPVGIVANLIRHAAGRSKRFRFDSVRLQVRIEQEPNPDSRVTLAGTTDAFGQRQAHVHWSLTERDKHTMRVAAEVFDAELRRLGLGKLEMAAWLGADRRGWPPDMAGGHHHMGTTRMADDPRTGVVDADCRAHSLDNLYIAGSSVFPTAGYANPTMTLLALAFRLAAHLRARHR